MSEDNRFLKIYVLFFLNLYLVHGFGFPFKGGLKFLPEKQLNTSDLDVRWMKQLVDHFNETDTRTWNMRYYQNMEFYQTNGPIYLFISGEASVDHLSGYLKIGFIYDIAKETNGALIMPEHRYYGNSLPFRDLVTSNLKYLSSQQALADFATLLKYLKSTFITEKSADSKVVVVGGSYAGNLAAWMKLLYNDLVDAVISVSAPVLAKENFLEYFEVVGQDFLQYGTPECYHKIKQMFKSYENLLGTPEGINELKIKENICGNNDLTKKQNRQLFFWESVNSFAHTAQNGMNVDEFKEFCEKIVNSSGIEFLSHNEGCKDVDFDTGIKQITPDTKSWLYQTCTEFGFFQTSDSNKQPFTHNVPIEFFIDTCIALFGSDFNEKRVEEGIKITNAQYGGRYPNITKVVFVNGDVDPWHTLGVLENLSDDAPAILIHKSFHCQIMSPEMDQDSDELREARKKVKLLIKSWIGL